MRWRVAVAVVILTGCARQPGVLRVESAPARAYADGESQIEVAVAASRAISDSVTVDLIDGARRATLAPAKLRGNGAVITMRAGVLPGMVRLKITARGFTPLLYEITFQPDLADADGDGTPDALRLDGAADREAFQRWFTFLAESQYFTNTPAKDIVDCAALLRFAYRETLRDHDKGWATALHLPPTPALGSIAKYHYPYTLLGAALFRVQPPPFQPGDLTNGAFAEFADAETLMRRNTFFITRDIQNAEPGDLLFYRQLQQEFPFHAMIFLGPSHLEDDRTPHIIYHTGPAGKLPGEIRRPTVAELKGHPSPRWRPDPGNPNFLGVFRWNILRDEL
ncbi:MAG: DUF1175 family protein [Bryobacteraceae bacterium]